MKMTVRLSDLVQRHMEQSERASFERLKAELTRAFAAPGGSYHPLSAAEVIARTRSCPTHDSGSRLGIGRE